MEFAFRENFALLNLRPSHDQQQDAVVFGAARIVSSRLRVRPSSVSNVEAIGVPFSESKSYFAEKYNQDCTKKANFSTENLGPME